MAPKTHEQFTVICDGLFLNNTKPEKWEQNFPWEPSVGFHYRHLDESGEPTGDGEKKYLKKIWLFQAMGGQNAKGKYYRLEAEHGEIPAKEGKPAKPYVSITPLAEVFSDGTARFLEEPKNGKVNVPAAGDKPKGPVTPPGPKSPAGAGTKPSTPAKPGPAKPETSTSGNGAPVDLNTKKAEGFLRDLQTPQSDAWWIFKTQVNLDGADATNVLDFAKQMTLIEMSKAQYEGDNWLADLRSDALASMTYWTEIMRSRLLAMKFSNIRARLSHYLGLCQTVENLDKVLYKAWVELPESDFLALREEALARHKVVIAETVGGIFKGKIKGTLQPELMEVRTAPFTEEELDGTHPEESEPPGESSEIPAVIPGVPDANEIAFTVRGINNLGDFAKLMNFWNTTRPALQAVEQVKQAMRLWVADLFMKAKYTADVEGIREKLPPEILTMDLQKTLHARYAELEPF